jgi:hypothetical protein
MAVRESTHLPRGETHRDSDSSQTARRSFCEDPANSLASVEQTAHVLLATGNPGRPWSKQVRSHRGKCPLAKTSHHPQAPGETAGMHENGSGAPRPAGQVGSNLAADPLHRAARDEARAGIGSSFVWSGSAGQKRLLIRRRSPQKPSP